MILGNGRIDCCKRVAQVPPRAHVERNRDVTDSRVCQRLDRAIEHDGRKVLDTVKAQVLERFHSLALACAGRTGYEDDTRRIHYEAFFTRTRERADPQAYAVDRRVVGEASRARHQTSRIRPGAAPRRAAAPR